MIILLYIIIEILMILLINREVKHKLTKKIMYIYVFIHMNLLILSMFNPVGLYGVSSRTYLLWLINIMIFILTLVIINKYRKEEIVEKETHNKIEERILNSKTLLYGQIVLSFYALKFYLLTRNIADPALIRMVRFEKLFGSYAENIIYTYFIGFLYKTMTIITSILLVNKKIKNPITIIGVINIFLFTLIGYGRMHLYEFVLFIIFAYILNYEKNKDVDKEIQRKNIRFIITVFAIIFGIALISTAIRLGISIFNFKKIYDMVFGEQVKQIIIYFTGGFRALDNFLINGFSGIPKYTFGRATFAGIEELLSIFLLIFGKEYSTFNSIVGELTQSYIVIGENIYFNAFYTCVMNYISDFGYFGVIIYPILHGTFLFFSIKNENNKKNLISQILLIFVLSNTVSTIYRWNYQFGSNTFILITYIIINTIQKRGKHGKKIYKENIFKKYFQKETN